MKVKIFTQCGEDTCFSLTGCVEERINEWFKRKGNIDIQKITQSQSAIGYSCGISQYKKNQVVICIWYKENK